MASHDHGEFVDANAAKIAFRATLWWPNNNVCIARSLAVEPDIWFSRMHHSSALEPFKYVREMQDEFLRFTKCVT